MEVLIIHYSNESGSNEGCYITDDLDKVAEDVIPFGTTVTGSVINGGDFPSGFPFDYCLKRQ